MKILIVYCHPIKESFNHAVLESVETALSGLGHDCRVADLYAEKFDPVMVEADFAQFLGKPMPTEIQQEQARFEWAEGIVFIFPVWWWSIPAMLKGWIDRVISYGWAWKDPLNPESGYLHSRKLLVIPTAGASKRAFEKRGYDQSFFTQLTIGTWRYCGITDVTTEFLYEIHADAEQAHLDSQIQHAADTAIRVFSN